MSLAAFYGRCPTCGHDNDTDNARLTRAIEQEVIIEEAAKLSKYLIETESKAPFEIRKEVTKPQEPVEIPDGDEYAETYKLAVTKEWVRGWNNCKDLMEAFPAPPQCQKPQEPVAWVEVVDRHEGPYNFHGKELLDSGKHNLYTAQQPCQGCLRYRKNEDLQMHRAIAAEAKCAELEEALECSTEINRSLVDSAGAIYKQQAERIASLEGSLSLAVNSGIDRIAELEADIESLTEENDSRLETSIKQHARIMALEAEVERKMSAGQFLAEKIKELETMSVGNKEGMALVTKEDAENYCRILSLLGMEEEGSPVEDIERLISLRDGMTCGDCNDTGWLENREEERYPCTCMTEAEPYQLLEVERDDWKSRYESSLSVNQMHSDNNAEMLKFNAKLLADIEALKKQNNAYAMLTKSQDSRLSEYYAKSQQYKDAVATLDSEKEANAILTQERDELAMQIVGMREALTIATTTPHMGQDAFTLKVQDAAFKALALPDLSAEVIKRHDAAIREEMLDLFRLKHRDYANELAAELGKA